MKPALAVCCAVTTVFATGAEAQFIAFRGDQVGASIAPGIVSTRLQSLGNLSLTIEDESNELTLSDFGGNLAGVAMDKDGWSIETSTGKARRADDFDSEFVGIPIAQRLVSARYGGVAEIFFRRDGELALGGRMHWDVVGYESRFGADDRTRGPHGSLYFSDKFGPVRAAIGLSRWSDNQDVTSPDVFSIRHLSTATTTTLAFAARQFRLDWGMQFDFDNVQINGKSRDQGGFHQDEFEWHRPTTRGRLSVLVPPGGRLEAGANLTVLRRNGAEEARLSWADRFPENPGGVFYSARIPTFEETERGIGLEGRARLRLRPELQLGLYAGYEHFTSKIDESLNFIGSRRRQDLDRTRMRLGAGLGRRFAEDRFQVAVEGYGRFEDESLDLTRASTDVSSREVELRVGAEWFARPDWAIRAGLERASVDEDLDLPGTLQIGNGVSLGAGWTPRGGIVSLDAGMHFRADDPKDEVGGSRKAELFEYSVASRFLF